MTNAKLRVLLADDHVLVREGLKRLVDEQQDMEVVGEAGDGPEALRLCQELMPDIALVDVSMPSWDGIRTAEALRSACPQMKIVSVTRHDDESFVRRMFAAGASGYVLKQSPPSNLTNGIRTVARGEAYVDPLIRRSPHVTNSIPASAFREKGSDDGSTPRDSLTDVEKQVLRLLALSYSGREIGEQLGLAPQMVSIVKARAMAKVGLQTRVQLIQHARQHGW